MAEKPLVSIVLSFRNEEELIPELVRKLQGVLRPLPVRYELVFVNDDSTDRSLEVLQRLRQSEEPAIKVLNMSRRFGREEGFIAGMEYCKGDAAVIMDSDLQDPPEVVRELIEKWLEGADVVYTVRLSRAGESALKMFITKTAYRCIEVISDTHLPANAGDFKLVSRRVMNEVLKLKGEKDPYLRGMVSWMGFKQVPVFYHRQARAGGKTHFPVLGSMGPVKTLLNGLTSFSVIPLYLLLLLGVLAGVVAAVLVLVTIVLAIFQVGLSRGWLLGVFLTVLSALQLGGIGLLALYVSRIHNQVLKRPNYIIASRIGFE